MVVTAVFVPLLALTVIKMNVVHTVKKYLFS